MFERSAHSRGVLIRGKRLFERSACSREVLIRGGACSRECLFEGSAYSRGFNKLPSTCHNTRSFSKLLFSLNWREWSNYQYQAIIRPSSSMMGRYSIGSLSEGKAIRGFTVPDRI